MSEHVVVIDNYDSFTYNLVQYLGQLGTRATVVRNDAATVADVVASAPIGVIISPGPCTPSEAGISTDLVRNLGPRVPLLGVCLGHQCIGAAFGAMVVRADRVMHGKVSDVSHDGRGIFVGIPSPFRATRYHSLVIDPRTIPGELAVTASTSDGVVMGVRHGSLPIEGVQFHPESIATEHGIQLVANFLDTCRRASLVAAR